MKKKVNYTHQRSKVETKVKQNKPTTKVEST